MKFSWIKNATPAQISVGTSIGLCLSIAAASIPFNISADATNSANAPRPATTEPDKARYSPPPISGGVLHNYLRNGYVGSGPTRFCS